MKIDASRYAAFWRCPEAFRIREGWKIQPEEPKPGTFASLLTFGRRRGTVLHELLDANYRGVPEEQALQELKDGGFSEKEISVAREMAHAVLAKYADEEILIHEQTFEYRIPNSPHSMVGRIDSIVRRDDQPVVKDCKSTKQRTKVELQRKGEEYTKGVQVPFYLVGSRTFGTGLSTNTFIYYLVEQRKSGVAIYEFPTTRTNLELNEFARSVHQTAETILFYKREFGLEKPWPILPEVFKSGYAPLYGHKLYEDYVPEGYQSKREHLSIAEIF